MMIDEVRLTDLAGHISMPECRVHARKSEIQMRPTSMKEISMK